MDHFVVHRNAERLRKTLVALEGGSDSVASKVPGRHCIKMGGGDTRLDLAGQEVERLHSDRVRLVELVELSVGTRDHAGTASAGG